MDKTSLKHLREWFKKNAANLPWRPADLDAPRDPYAVWISETMLQQTQVSTVREYFIRWMERFPDVEALAAAEESEVFRYWQGLGYYSRARNILKTTKIINQRKMDGSRRLRLQDDNKATMPTTRMELEALPGIGAYTAGAILSLAYHQQEAILDGNLVRIFSRLYALDFLPTDKRDGKSASEIYWNYAREVAESPKAYMHNEALMELGRTVCKIKNPDCASCPFQKVCRAALENRTAEFPPAKTHIQKDWHGTILVIESADHKILAVHGGQKFFKNQFTLPHFESPRNATAGIPAQAEVYINADHVSAIENIGQIKHNITVHKIECDVLHIQISSKAPVRNHSAKTAHEIQWVKREEAQEFFANSFCLKALALL
ncbi:MAG: A/G-specific adenine glycosylase [Fibrobacter sp.]|uniref:A/G-specific adenine glycosylase n=1 Tax=Fibrobacter sp. TaxID=35828 RepID=UPI002A90A557|nr:A/G-specific adenine glycosylase [Fibrobacter sp.]MDY6263008.1 A/G-specific adenine glycosylase [Fibrobacter sp.]